MGFKKPEETRVEVSGYTTAYEAGTVLWKIENAFEAMDVGISEDQPESYSYSDTKIYKVTLIIEEV